MIPSLPNSVSNHLGFVTSNIEDGRIATSRLRFLRTAQVKQLNALIEGPRSCVRDAGMLESAINSPINQQHYGQENDPFQLGAILSHKITKNHAFANGNKRTALLAANLFLLQHRSLQQDAGDWSKNNALTQAQEHVAMGTMKESRLADIYRTVWHQSHDTTDSRNSFASLPES